MPLLVYLLVEAGVKAGTGLRRGLLFILLCAAGAFTTACSVKYGFARRFFNDHFRPRAAAEFLARSAPELPQRVLYNPWGWGGYLYSGFDQQYGSLHGWGSLPDRNNHGVSFRAEPRR